MASLFPFFEVNAGEGLFTSLNTQHATIKLNKERYYTPSYSVVVGVLVKQAKPLFLESFGRMNCRGADRTSKTLVLRIGDDAIQRPLPLMHTERSSNGVLIDQATSIV